MRELIWYSTPGAVISYALYLAFPNQGWGHGLYIVVLAPAFGFGTHQLYRAFFRIIGGWRSPKRPVIGQIRDQYSLEDRDAGIPALVWETTLYSDELPGVYRELNSRLWFEFISLRSIVLPSGLAAVLLWLLLPYDAQVPGYHLGVLLGVMLLCWIESKLRYATLTRQEVAFYQSYRDEFDQTFKTLSQAADQQRGNVSGALED